MEDVPDKPVYPRGSSKRSRAAEVHNLSEKVVLHFELFFFPFKFVIGCSFNFVHFPYVYVFGFLCVGLLGRGGGAGLMRK